MWPDAVLDRFVEQCPAAVMVRATLENLVSPDRLDEIFADASQRQYEKELLFSQVVALMMGVATRTHTSVHAGYLAAKDRLAVSPAALYGKLNRLEPGLSATMIRETSQDAAQVIDAMPGHAANFCRAITCSIWTGIIWRRLSIGWRNCALRGKALCPADLGASGRAAGSDFGTAPV